jgi:hypothetical protein
MCIDIAGALSNDNCLPRSYPAFDARLRSAKAGLAGIILGKRADSLSFIQNIYDDALGAYIYNDAA